MLDHQLSYLSAYFQGKIYFHGSVWGGFPISATKGGSFTETENAQSALKWILIKNIARGITDPGYCVYNLSYLSSKKNAISVKKKIQVKDFIGSNFGGAACISSMFGH